MQSPLKLCLRFLAILLIVRHLQSKRYFIPHSHQDLGWLKTIDQYYDLRVRSILNTVLEALEADAGTAKNNLPYTDRKFVYAEIGFLRHFLDEDPASRAAKISRILNLIKAGKFEFVNGGMSQADSACP